MNKDKEYYQNEWHVSIENIKRVLAGKGSLRVAFWGFWIIGTALISLVLNIIFSISFGFGNENQIYSWYHINEKYILLFYLTFSTILVWRNSLCTKKHWLYLARAFTLWVVITNLYEILKNIIDL